MKNPESKAIFTKLEQQMNQWSGIIFFVVTVVTPYCFIAPKVLESLFLYYVTNFKNDVLELPLPMW